LNIAHIREYDKTVQSLEDHLKGTSLLCRDFASKMGLGCVGEILGLLHDMGKASSEFNSYITDNPDGLSRGEVDHSTAGAQFL